MMLGVASELGLAIATVVAAFEIVWLMLHDVLPRKPSVGSKDTFIERLPALVGVYWQVPVPPPTAVVQTTLLFTLTLTVPDRGVPVGTEATDQSMSKGAPTTVGKRSSNQFATELEVTTLPLIWWLTELDVLSLKFESPTYFATMLFAPA